MSVVALFVVLAPAAVATHPAPFSYLDVRLGTDGLSGRLSLHDLDVAHELTLDAPERLAPERLAEEAFVRQHLAGLAALLSARLRFEVDGVAVPWTITGGRPLPDQQAVELDWRAAAGAPIGRLSIAAYLFPYDPIHQTFVNIFENGVLVRQEVLNAGRRSLDFYAGTRQGLSAIITAFVRSGIHHIAIGPDHILFVVGLLLMGGSIWRLLAIVTAFTIGHSVTLALATLQIVDPPLSLVEPAIALSIVYVGADNLIARGKGRDVRPWVALVFGLIHGFGFASVLRDAGLPNRALMLSLFSFNVGVEIGQAVIVAVVTSLLAALRAWRPAAARWLATAGSIVVMAAGAIWFVQRVF